MNGRITSVSDALDVLVPQFEADSGDWEGIVNRANPALPAASNEAENPRPGKHGWTRHSRDT